MDCDLTDLVLKARIVSAIRLARFPALTQQSICIIYEAIELARDFKKNRYTSYNAKKLTRRSYGAPRPRGRSDESAIRHYLFSCLFSVWERSFGVEPKVNKKDALKPTRFVVFVESLLEPEGFGKIINHLEEYRTYRRLSWERNQKILEDEHLEKIIGNG